MNTTPTRSDIRFLLVEIHAKLAELIEIYGERRTLTDASTDDAKLVRADLMPFIQLLCEILSRTLLIEDTRAYKDINFSVHRLISYFIGDNSLAYIQDEIEYMLGNFDVYFGFIEEEHALLNLERPVAVYPENIA